MKPILVIMAAGMGSRFGGMKQIEPVGPNGEIILDYACFDAIRAGYEKIVFVVKKENEALVREVAGDRIAYVGPERPKEDFGEVYDGAGRVLMPGFVNAHSHSAMT
ncbi:MAG: NTP transferase domain-containing protein, partial [Clostridia bacterium]|nr:NTP transferase domain-containing protein [Clostridia bacterium]